MTINIVVGMFFFLFILYWQLLFQLVNAILESPRLKKEYWFLVGIFNAGMLFSLVCVWPNATLSYSIMMLLMLVEFMVFYRDSFTGAVLCTLACSIHVLALFIQDIETGDVKAFVCVKNINDEKKKQLELEYQAQRDPLTGLYNRNTSSKLIDEYITFSHSPTESALFMIDVDNFKEINDHLGHLYGDAVLCELADKLAHTFRSDDIIGRIGGDEYIVFMKNGATEKIVQAKAEEVCRIINTSTVQTESISQITLGVKPISDVVGTNSATSEESAAASEELSGQAEMMDSLVSRFKLKNYKE